MPTKNITLRQKYGREWYSRNREHAIKKIRERKALIKEWFRQRKSTLKCVKCHENHPASLDFHHENPLEKDIPLARIVANGWSVERIEKEISKCIVLCSNCHRKLHYEEKQLLENE